MPSTIADRHPVSVFAVGAIAGIIGGIFVDLFLSLANHASLTHIWQFVASGLVGSVAFTAPSYAIVGLVLHLCISIVWGVIYAWLAFGPWPFLARNGVVGGVLYGVVVMVAMTVLLMLKHMGPGGPPDAGMVVKSLIAHTVFFGLPVGLYVSRAAKR